MTEPDRALSVAPLDLAAQINAAHDEVIGSMRRTVEHAIKAGNLLLQAKADPEIGRHGKWLEWVCANCKFGERTAQLYMRLAQEPALGSKTKSISDLTMTDAIKLLEPAKSPPDEKRKSSSSGSGKPKVSAVAVKNDPLSVLQQAWDVAGETERRLFISRNGLRPSLTSGQQELRPGGV
jgi:hypothetical protein